MVNVTFGFLMISGGSKGNIGKKKVKTFLIKVSLYYSDLKQITNDNSTSTTKGALLVEMRTLKSIPVIRS